MSFDKLRTNELSVYLPLSAPRERGVSFDKLRTNELRGGYSSSMMGAPLITC